MSHRIHDPKFLQAPRVDQDAVIAAYAKDHSIQRVGKQFGCSGTWVSKVLQKYGIPRDGKPILSDKGRRSMIAKKIGKRCSRATEFKKGSLVNLGRRDYDPKNVVRAYRKVRTINGTARALGMSTKTVKRYLDDAGVKRVPVPKELYASNFQGKTDPNRNTKEKISCACGCGTSILRYAEGGRERKFALGHNAKSDYSQVCDECGKPFKCIRSAHRRFCSTRCGAKYQWKMDHDRMKAACSINKRRGKDHHAWNGGSSFDPYPVAWTRSFKKEIHKRDGHACALCGKTKESCHRKLSVHHIDYDKENLDPDNLILLCGRCHGVTNTDRGFWTEWLGQLIANHTSKECANVA